MFTSFVPNFLGFAAVGVILVAMIGVGVAEYSGLVGALIRKLVAVSSQGSLTYIIVFVGILSSVASDDGLPRADPARGGGVHQRGATSARRESRRASGR